jgi:EAL domain-containing protein (putative c-di-GMP-specific phosphodiesterase class I)
MQTVAEFVHSDSVQRRVKDLGIDYSQGYVIGVPEPELPAVSVSGSVTRLVVRPSAGRSDGG